MFHIPLSATDLPNSHLENIKQLMVSISLTMIPTSRPRETPSTKQSPLPRPSQGTILPRSRHILVLIIIHIRQIHTRNTLVKLLLILQAYSPQAGC